MEILRPMTALGLMSGTSLDGVDAALIITDGIDVFEMGASITRPYPDVIKDSIRAILGKSIDEAHDEIKKVERDMTLFHADVCRELLSFAQLDSEDVDIIGFHGHTILHRPEQKYTCQIGDGKLLADQLGIQVVNRFRNVDVASGGQGAPLAPVFHQAMCKDIDKPVIVLNIGGVANVTWIGDNGELIAFDTGTGNAMIDDWALRHTGVNIDLDGMLAVKGQVNKEILQELMQNPYFNIKPPKSLDRDDFVQSCKLTDDLSVVDGAATLTSFTVESIAQGIEEHLPAMPAKCIVCGGGCHNPTMMRMLRMRLPQTEIITVKDVGWNIDAFEAQAFAYMAARSLFGLPISFPATTGINQPSSGGAIHKPSKLL